MNGAMQLTIDGREVPYEAAAAERNMPMLTISQRMILERIDSQGGIRPLDAGDIAHGMYRATRSRYASSDGVSALRRLARRGLVKHRRRGWWVRPDAPRESRG